MILDRRKYLHYLKVNRPDWFSFVEDLKREGFGSADKRSFFEVSNETAKVLADFVGVQPRDLELKFAEPKLVQATLF